MRLPTTALRVLVLVLVLVLALVAAGGVATAEEATERGGVEADADADADADATLRGSIQARLKAWSEAREARPKKTAVSSDVVQTLFVASEPVVKYYLCPDALDSKCAVRFRRLLATDGTAAEPTKYAIISSGKKQQELVSSIDANGKPQVAWVPKLNNAPWAPTHANNTWILTRVSEWVDYAVVGLNVGGHNYVLTVNDAAGDNTNRELVMSPFYGVNFADDNMMATAVWVVDRTL